MRQHRQAVPVDARVTDSANLIHDFTAMASRADEMLWLAMSSFAKRDLDAANSLVELDQSVNLAHHRFSQRLLDIDGDGRVDRAASCARC